MTFPLDRLKALRAELAACSQILKKHGYTENAVQTHGAADIIKTWIVGIKKEEALK